MKTFTIISAGFVAATLIAGAVLAQGGSNGVFSIHNNTTDNTVVGFYTNDGSGWSDNWLAEELVPGVVAEASLFAESGNCDQTFQVG